MTSAPTAVAATERDFEPPYMATGVMFLVAARFAAWLIALFVWIVDARPEPNLRYEPTLLIVTFLQIVTVLAYVPLIRPWLRRWSRSPLRGREDLLLLSALDLAASVAILFLSGGLGTPYYHFAVVALLVPTFLLGWRGSIAVLAAFMVAIIASWEFSGYGRDLWATRGNMGGANPGLLITPALVILVSQYLAWLTRRTEASRTGTEVALNRTAALYRVAQGLTQGGNAAHLAEIVVAALRDTGRFDELVIVDLDRVEVLPADFESVDGDLVRVRVRRVEGESPRVCYAIPFGSERTDHLAIAFHGPGAEPGGPDVRLVRAAARQLTLALARLALEEERGILVAAEERARIAREIHDGIAQSIYMLSLQLDRLADQAGPDSELAGRLASLTALSKEALVDVRQYIFDVKPLLTGEQSLGDTMRRQATEFSTVAEIPVAVDVRGDEPLLPVPIRTALYRIGQEGLANAVRHARASRIDLRLEFDESRVRLEVSDDGIGFDPARENGGHGLGNIRQRVEEFGGTCQIRSSPTAGTTIRIEVPTSAISAEVS